MVQYCCTYQTPLSIGHEVAEVAASLVLQRQVQLRIEDSQMIPRGNNYIELSAKFRKGLLTALMRDRDGVHPEGGALRQDADEDGGPPLPPPIRPPDILQVLY